LPWDIISRKKIGREESSMKNKKIRILVIVVLVIGIIAAGFIGYGKINSGNPSAADQNQPVAPKTTAKPQPTIVAKNISYTVVNAPPGINIKTDINKTGDGDNLLWIIVENNTNKSIYIDAYAKADYYVDGRYLGAGGKDVIGRIDPGQTGGTGWKLPDQFNKSWIIQITFTVR